MCETIISKALRCDTWNERSHSVTCTTNTWIHKWKKPRLALPSSHGASSHLSR